MPNSAQQIHFDSLATLVGHATVNWADYAMAQLLGHNSQGDGFNANYLFDPTSTASHNFPLVIKQTLAGATGRWILYAGDNADWNSSVASSRATILNKPSLATVATSGSYNDLSNKPSILGISSTSSIASGGRNFNQAYQLSTDKYADIRVSISISCSLSLTAGASGEVFLEYSADGSSGWTLAGKSAGSNTGTLTIGLNTTQITGGQLGCMLQPGYYWRLRTNNVSGTPTYTFTGGVEIIY